MKKYLFALTFVLLIGCQNTNNSLQNNVVNNTNQSKQDVLTTNTNTNTDEQKIEISVSENNLYAGQKAAIDIQLFSKGQAYSSNPEDFTLTASVGKIEGNVYKASENSLQDSLTIKHNPSGFVKTIPITILSSPKLVVDLGNTQSCGDTVNISPKVLIGDISQNFSVNEFDYSSQTGSFSGNIYQCPTYETQDTLVVYYKPLGLKKEIPITVNAKPILTVENVPESIEKNEKVSFVAFFKKAQNRQEISSGELNFSADMGSFSKNTYTATTVGTATITITHSTTGQKIKKTIIVKDSLSLVVDLPSDVENFTTLIVKPMLMRSKQQVNAPYDEFSFQAERGKFNNNVYAAPAVTATEKSVNDTITITHKIIVKEKGFTQNKIFKI